MSISAWLQELGLERYVEAFEAHDVDTRTLPLLTETDLAEIGVKSLGHRRKLAEAIAALGTPELRAPAHKPQAGAVEAIAEYRQLTVLYCDMSRSAAQSSQDAEDMRKVIQSFHETCTHVVAEFDGYVANFYGDCLLAYFGWPRAHEDDPERAVRAGLALIRRVPRLTASGEALSSRVGIATGDVVVGDLIHEGPAREQSAVGLTPNLGARLLALAQTGQVAIDELTSQLLPSSFVLQSLGRHVLKGIHEPVGVYVVGGEHMADSRFDARKGLKLAPMIGRDQEFALLLERWAQARAGEGQAVLLVGEAGIGKSRLTRALLDACPREPRVTVRWQCSPYHIGSALWPVIQGLGRATGLGADDSNDASLDKLEALVGPDNAEATALYATLLGLNGTQRYGPLELTPQMLRERTLELLFEQLLEMANEQSLLLVVEDAHWIDPSTCELIERCLERIASTRMLILITSRPDNQPQLGAHPSVARLSLNRLSRASVQAIVTQLGGGGLNPRTLTTIATQADGVPLFVEELTKAVLETGEAAVPASLHGSLMARLDRIPEVKEVAQVAACIGREFDQALVQAVAERSEAVGAALDKLTEVELVFRRGEPANPRYTFKHALVQEAAYESLLRGKRRSLHARILEALESERPQTPPEILARHAESASLVDRAIGYWQRAGDAALRKSAFHEAIAYLGNAIRLIDAQADGIDRRAQELELQLGLGLSQIVVHGFGAQAAREAYARASELLDADRSRAHRLRVQYGLWVWHLYRADPDGALRLASEAVAAEESNGTPGSLPFARRLMATSLAHLGRLAAAQDCYEQSMGLLDAGVRNELSARFGFDPGIALLYHYSWTLCLRGLVGQSRELTARARSLCNALTQSTTLAHLHLFSAICAACVRDSTALGSEAQVLKELTTKYRLSQYVAYVDALFGWAAMESAPSVEEVAAFRRSLDRLVAEGSLLFIPFFSARLAVGLSAGGRDDEALQTIDRALTQCDEMSQGWCDAELWRVRGDLLLRGASLDLEQARRCFERALDLSRRRGAKLWELRASTDLARLWIGRGEHARVPELLNPIHDWFPRGLETVDLAEARALLTRSGTAG